MTEFNGLPAHILLIHLVVVGVPVAALLTVLSAVWPAASTRLGLATPIIALLALICVPFTTNAGEWLQRHVYLNPATANGQAILHHISIGKDLLPWAVGLFLLAVMAWGRPTLVRRSTGPAVLGSAGVKIGIGVLAVVIAAVATFQVYRIGDAGAKASWSSNFCPTEIAVGASCPSS